MFGHTNRRSTLFKDVWDKLNTASVQLAIQVLGLSRDETIKLQGFNKSLLDEEEAGGRKWPIELLIIERFQREWGNGAGEQLDKAQAALRECVTALRLGLPVIQSRESLSSAIPPQPVNDQPFFGADDSPRPPLIESPLARSNFRDSGLNNDNSRPSTSDARTQAENNTWQESFGEHCIRRLRGLHHEVLEVHGVPRGNCKLVVVENAAFLGVNSCH